AEGLPDAGGSRTGDGVVRKLRHGVDVVDEQGEMVAQIGPAARRRELQDGHVDGVAVRQLDRLADLTLMSRGNGDRGQPDLHPAVRTVQLRTNRGRLRSGGDAEEECEGRATSKRRTH